MKIKLSQAVMSVEALNKLVDIKLPIKASYSLKRLTDKLGPELKAFDEKRSDLLKELGTVKEDGVTYDLGKNAKKFTDDVNSLLDSEFEIDFNKIKIDDLGNAMVEPKYLHDWIFE